MFKTKRKFNALDVAQEILDFDKIIIWKEDRLGVAEWGKFRLYGKRESTKIIHEFYDMFEISKRCQFPNDILRQKLETILFVCKPIAKQKQTEDPLVKLT